MPHVNIKHFSPSISKEQQTKLVKAITQTITDIFQCSERVVSIALEPIEKENWTLKVYNPEIVNRENLLCKKPNY
ncbi:MAG: tautomerase family protein [Proteobacteria bacterium]|nr:tautomerase family protein [Pseudomonadota bacterium]